jgi:hypothetical protein
LPELLLAPAEDLILFTLWRERRWFGGCEGFHPSHRTLRSCEKHRLQKFPYKSMTKPSIERATETAASRHGYETLTITADRRVLGQHLVK